MDLCREKQNKTNKHTQQSPCSSFRTPPVCCTDCLVPSGWPGPRSRRPGRALSCGAGTAMPRCRHSRPCLGCPKLPAPTSLTSAATAPCLARAAWPLPAASMGSPSQLFCHLFTTLSVPWDQQLSSMLQQTTFNLRQPLAFSTSQKHGFQRSKPQDVSHKQQNLHRTVQAYGARYELRA